MRRAAAGWYGSVMRMLRLSTVWSVPLVMMCLVGGCKEGLATGSTLPSSPADDLKAAQDLFATRCLPCHGAGGAGDGPAAAGLSPRPPDFTSAAWQGSITDEKLERAVLYGGAAVGKSALMPANPDLDGRTGVLKGLRAHIRSMGR